MKHGRWGVWIERFELWGPSRSEPSPSVVATETYGVSHVCVKLNVLGLSDEVVVEGKYIPDRQEMFYFVCIIQTTRSWREGMVAALVKRLERKDLAGGIMQMAWGGKGGLAADVWCICLPRDSPTEAEWCVVFSLTAEMPRRKSSPGLCLGTRWRCQALSFSLQKEGRQVPRKLFWE